MQHIPGNVKPRDQNWQAGEKVSFVTAKGTWQVGIVLHNGRGRFSAGWNAFAKDNKLKKSNTLLFTLTENNEGPCFTVEK